MPLKRWRSSYFLLTNSTQWTPSSLSRTVPLSLCRCIDSFSLAISSNIDDSCALSVLFSFFKTVTDSGIVEWLCKKTKAHTFNKNSKHVRIQKNLLNIKKLSRAQKSTAILTWHPLTLSIIHLSTLNLVRTMQQTGKWQTHVPRCTCMHSLNRASCAHALSLWKESHFLWDPGPVNVNLPVTQISGQNSWFYDR